MMKLLLLAALNFAVFIFAISVQQRFFKCERRGEKLFVWIFSYVSVIVVFLTVLGSLQCLSLASASAAAALLGSASYLLMRPSLRFLRQTRLLLKTLQQDLIGDKFLFISSLLVGLIIFYKLVFAIVAYPYEEDSLFYHIPMAVSFLQSGNFFDVSHYNFYWSFPSNSELLSLWFLLPFHNDALVNLQNFPIFVGLCCLAFLLCREAGLEKKWCIWSALLTASFPAFIQFLDTQKNEMLVAFWVLSSVFFLERYSKDKKWIYLFCGSASLGLLVGTKLTGLLFAAIITAVYEILFLFRRKSVPPFLSLFSLVLVVFVCVGSFWYVRNLIAVNNPIYPSPVKISNRTVFEGRESFADSTSVFAVAKRASIGGAAGVYSLLPISMIKGGHGSGILFLISSVAFLGWSVWQRSNRRSPCIRLMVIAMLFLSVYCFIPYSGAITNQRALDLDVLRSGDGMRFISAGFILGIVAFVRFYQGGFKTALLASAVILNLLMNPRDILLGLFIGFGIPKEHFLSLETLGYVLSLLLALVFIYVIALLVLKHFLSSGRKAGYVVVPFCAFVLMTVSIKQAWRAEFYAGLIRRYSGESTGLFQYVENNIEGKKIILAPMSIAAPFYGKHFDNQVWARPRQPEFVVGNQWDVSDKDCMIICGNYSSLTQEQFQTIPLSLLQYIKGKFHVVYSDNYSFVFSRTNSDSP
ncbi:MAG: hypothetical protein WBW16_06915 [Bacteroidota bacterium]